jgi:hypothetical protein
MRPTFWPGGASRRTVEAWPICWWLPPPWGCSTGFMATPRTCTCHASAQRRNIHRQVHAGGRTAGGGEPTSDHHQTCTMQMYSYLLGAVHLRPAVALHAELVVRVASLQQRLLRPPATRHLAHHRAACAWQHLQVCRTSFKPVNFAVMHWMHPSERRLALQCVEKHCYCRKWRSLCPAPRCTFFEPDGSLIRETPVSVLCATTMQ